MKTFAMFMLAALCGLAGSVQARENVVIERWPNASSNAASATPLVDTDVNLNRDTPTAGSKGDALRMTAVNLNRVTGDSTTSWALTAYNETNTKVIDSSTPIRGLIIRVTSVTTSQFDENVAGYAMVGVSVFGKTAANLRQGFFPVKPGKDLVLNDIMWYNTTGSSVSVFTESVVTGLFHFHMQVIR